MSDSLQPHELQAPPSMEFSRQGHWSGFPLHSPGDLLTQGSNRVSYIAGRFFTINNSAGSSGLWTHTLEDTGALIQHLRSRSHAIPRALLGLWLHFCSYLLSSEPWALWGRHLAKLSFILSSIMPGTLYMIHNC